MRRPHPLLLLPAVGALLCFASAHREYALPTAALLALVLAYVHTGSAPAMAALATRRGLGAAMTVIAAAVAYDAVILEFERGLQPVSRRAFAVATDLITLSGILAIGLLVWSFHRPDRPQPHLARVLTATGILMVAASNYYGPTPVWIAGALIFACGAIVATASVAERGRVAGRAALLGLCTLPIAGLTAAGAVATRAAERALLGLRGDFLHNLLPAYRGYLGGGRGLTIARDRRIALGDTLLATLTGETPPGYLRTQVLSEYRDGHWRALVRDGSELAGASPDMHGEVWHPLLTAKDRDHGASERTLEFLVDLGGVAPLPYAATAIASDDAVTFHAAEGGLVRVKTSEELRRYRLREPAASAATEAVIAIEAEAERGAGNRDLPDEVRLALHPIATAITGEASGDPLAAARLLADHLRRQHRYSFAVHLAKTGDPVVDFVRNRRAGWCEHFAAALTLLLRSVGHEARVVGGFHVDERHPWLEVWTMRERDAHAWSEVFDPATQRWQVFDATPPVGDDQARSLAAGGTLRALRETARLLWRRVLDAGARLGTGAKLAAAAAALFAWLSAHRLIALAVAGAVLMALMKLNRPFATLRRWLTRGQRSAHATTLAPHARRAAVAFSRLAAAMAAHGIVARSSDTVGEVAARLRPPHDTPYRAWAALYEQVRFDVRSGGAAVDTLERLTTEVARNSNHDGTARHHAKST